MNPDSASSSPATRRGRGTTRSTENTAAASVDDTIGAEEQRELPVHPEQQVRACGGDHHADRHAEGGQHSRGRQHPPHVGELRRQAALDEDDGQRDRAEMVGEQVVLEVQPEAVFADDDADAEEQQQGGQADRWPPAVATMLASNTSPPASSTRYSCCKAHFIPQLTSTATHGSV